MAPPFSSIFVFSLLFIGVFVQADQVGQSAAFTYDGSHGPQYWGELSPSFAACKNGKSQSPIDIVKDKTSFGKHLQTLIRKYTSANATLVNNGFNIGLHFGENSGGVAVIDGKNYSLKQMHWHSPSEHRLNGEQYVHLHPISLSLGRPIIGPSPSIIKLRTFRLEQIRSRASSTPSGRRRQPLRHSNPPPIRRSRSHFTNYNHRNPAKLQIQDKLGELAKERCGADEESHITIENLDTRQLRKKTRKYYRYVGSLTTPPCSENVISQVRTISKEQVEALKAPLDSAYKNNARPAQALNGRKIEIYDELSEY